MYGRVLGDDVDGRWRLAVGGGAVGDPQRGSGRAGRRRTPARRGRGRRAPRAAGRRAGVPGMGQDSAGRTRRCRRARGPRWRGRRAYRSCAGHLVVTSGVRSSTTSILALLAAANRSRAEPMRQDAVMDTSARRRPMPTSASYSITVRLYADGDPAGIGRIATAVGRAGGAVTAIDVVDSRPDGLTVDVTCSAADADALRGDGRGAARRRRRQGAQGQRPHVPAAPRRQDRGRAPGCR